MPFQTPTAGTDIYKRSFFPLTIRDWNALPESLISSAEIADDFPESIISSAEIADDCPESVISSAEIADDCQSESVISPAEIADDCQSESVISPAEIADDCQSSAISAGEITDSGKILCCLKFTSLVKAKDY